MKKITSTDVHNYLKSQRVLDIDTRRSYIEVHGDYCDFVCGVAEELIVDVDDMLDFFDELQANARIHCEPEDSPWIERIEIFDRISHTLRHNTT